MTFESASRSAAGYRQYDQRTLDRLAFIARARQLGCTLDEVADLTTAWDGGQCGPIQDRLRTLVAEKRATTQSRLLELIALSAAVALAAKPTATGEAPIACTVDERGLGLEVRTPDHALRVVLALFGAPA